jgi:hypothetical protein
MTGASEGCGGGVARWRSSLRIYVPAFVFRSVRKGDMRQSLTFAHHQLVFWPRRVCQDIVGFNHGRSLPIGHSKIIRSLGRVSGRWW